MIRFEREKQNPFSDDYLLDLLESAVSSDDDPLDLVFDEFRGSVKALIEELLRVEFNLHIGCDPYERTEARNDSRNGFYERDIETVFGVIEGLRVPRTRKNSFKTKLIGRYKRRQKQVGEVIKEMFLRGVSTRRVGMILTPLLGIEPSATTVSNTAKVLDAVVKGYHTRELSDEYIYLILDGVTMKVKEAPHAVRKMVLCAYGITADGRREMIDFRVVRAESEACCEAFLEDIWRRGMVGRNLKLVLTDGGAGFIKAAEVVYPSVPRQRCWAHKSTNIANALRRRNLEECMSGVRIIYNQENRRAAVKAFREWEIRWQDEEPAAVACLAKDLEEMLTFYKMPREHWKKVRTTNLIERIFREVRRRTNLMGAFANKESCERIIFSVFNSFNDRWQHHPFHNFTQNS
jgi:transposase-like protein